MASSEKTTNAFGGGLFNLGSTNSTLNNQPSVLFGSNTPTPIPFGSQTSNTLPNLAKSDITKPDKSSTAFEASVQKATVKTADKENAHKIEVPKPVHGGLVQDKFDTVQKPVATQPTLANFGIASSTAASINPTAPSISFGNTAAKDSTSGFSFVSSSQSNEVPKALFSTAATTAQPTATADSAPVNVAITNSVQSDFTFSLDKMGITSIGRI